MSARSTSAAAKEIALPPPVIDGPFSIEATLAARRSVRGFSGRRLKEAQLSQLLWAAQGVTDREGSRAAPSAGALYPLELYVALSRGFYHYKPGEHRLVLHAGFDARPGLCRAALAQSAVRQAPAVFVITADSTRTVCKYGEDWGPRYVYMEVGHAAQNLLLQAVALSLAGVPIGAFYSNRVRAVLELPAEEEPLYLVPVGSPR